MQVYYLQPVKTVQKHTGVSGPGAIPKLQTDLQKYFTEINVKILPIYAFRWDDEPEQSVSVRTDGLLGGLQQDDILLIATPTFYISERYLDTIIDHAKHVFGVKVVGITFDLLSFRHELRFAQEHHFSDFFMDGSRCEKDFLAQCDAIITQSNEMAQAMIDNFAITNPIIVHGPWGFYTERVPAPQPKTNTLLFAGSPGKAGYLNQLSHHIQTDFNIISDFAHTVANIEAPNFDARWTMHDVAPNIHITGHQYDASYVDQMLTGSFGLIWDSLTYPQVTGAFGKYMQLAMPHKFSMYTVAGIPSIVWSKSCLAPLVTQKKIGWVIDDLTELDQLISDITPDEYGDRVYRLDEFSNLIRSGFYTKRAIFNLIGALYNHQYVQPSADLHLTVGYQ